MAFTKVVGAGIHTLSNITSHNVHSSGIITATKFDGPFDNLNVTGITTFAGSVSIGGTLTYEDVTNIDSVGLVTARDGIFLPDTKKLELGNVAGSGDLQIYHDSSNSYIKDQGTGQLVIDGNAVILQYSASTKLETTNTGAEVTGTLTADGARFTDDGTSGPTVSIQTDDANPYALNIGNQSYSADTAYGLNFYNNNAGEGYFRFVGNSAYKDYHFSLHNNSTNKLCLKFEADDQSVELYAEGNKKLETTSSGVTVTGTVAATSFSGSGANLTGIAVTEAPVTDYTISANGSSAYRFHGGGVDETANSPDLYLIRGQKYRFNNTTGGGHPFAIRVSNGGSAYTDGVSGSQSGIQFFTVPYAAPASLVYQCTIHSGMIGNIYIRGGASTANISNNADNRLITGGVNGNLVGEPNLIFDPSVPRLTLDGDLWVEGQSNASGEIRLVHDQGNQNHDYWMLESNKDTHAFNIKSYGTGSYVDAVTISQNTRSVGILTSNIDAANLSNPVGAGHSLVGLYIGDGSLLFSSALSRTGGYYITTGVNALNAGPVTLNSQMTLDGTWVIV